MKKDKQDLQNLAEEILKEAEAKGFAENYYFASTFQRYKTQMQILEDLEKAIKQTGSIVKKTSATGVENMTTNPAIADYNKTSSAANNTITTLLKILESLATPTKKSGFSKLDDDDD